MQCTLVRVCVCVCVCVCVRACVCMCIYVYVYIYIYIYIYIPSKEHVSSIFREVKEQANWSNQKMEAAKPLTH